jgi:8-oxo-dGTP pyrophosphatase MutT (NUDIX family)
MSAPEPFIPLSSVPDFDPRAAPVVHVDIDLAPVAASRLKADFLRSRFMTPPIWQPERIAESRPTHHTPVPASVLIAIVQRTQPTVLLTQRTAHLSTHSGQIAFPGGKQDASDADLRTTALREAHEEVGLQAEFVQVLGILPIYATGTGFNITPVVALVREGFSLVRNPWEVDDVFEVPLAFLMNPANHRRHLFERAGMRREWLSMPYQDGETERFIWGATAGILRNFYRFLSA